MRKRRLALLLAFGLAATLVGCGKKPQESADGPYTPGSYEGSAQGYGGQVKVTLTVDAENITDVRVTGDQETPAVGGAALEELAKQIKEQGAEIDGVSGATVTSTAAKEAAASAIDQAKGGK